METTSRLLLVLLLVTGVAPPAAPQTSAATHNQWTSGAPMPTAVVGPVAGVLGGQIYVVGGASNFNPVADTQIYNPATNTWAVGVPLPSPLGDAAVAVVNGIFYVIGGENNSNGTSVLNTVWAYDPRTGSWSSKASMPTARTVPVAVVENGIIYVVGGWDGVFGDGGLDTVESYNPATDTWKEESTLRVGKMAPSGGLFGTKATGFSIAVPDGAAQCCPSGFTGDNEAYNASTNTWRSLKSDPRARGFACFGSVGQQLYVAGGNNTQGPALNVTESYSLPGNAWKTLAPIPQGTIAPASTVYNGRLYCFGGWDAWNGNDLDNVQVYQP